VLPPGFYAAGEQIADDDVDKPHYVGKQDRVAVRSTKGDRLVARVEIVSRSTKCSPGNLEALIESVGAAIEHDCHVLLVDLFPPGRFDPDGVHGAIWKQFSSEQTTTIKYSPVTIVSYRATVQPVAYVETCTVGRELPVMPLFLDANWYIETPLEETYRQAWEGFPAPWKEAVTHGA
jgi:hypothetical protein